jgi:hypothetical protein
VGLSESAASGDRRKALEDLRDLLAAAIDAGPPARDLSPLSRQFAAVLTELDQMAVPKEKSAVDDIAAKRAAKQRRAAAG